MNCPPYSPHLTPCDCFIYNTLINTVFGNNPATLDELEVFICEACNSCYVEWLQKVAENFIFRCVISVCERCISRVDCDAIPPSASKEQFIFDSSDYILRLQCTVTPIPATFVTNFQVSVPNFYYF